MWVIILYDAKKVIKNFRLISEIIVLHCRGGS